MMSRMSLKKGRTNQKLRTRKALLEAASLLVKKGINPTLADVAEEALVSKATAYRYFLSLDALLLEVSLDQKVEAPEHILRNVDELNLEERVAKVHDFLHQLVVQNEQPFRLFFRASMEQWLQSEGTPAAPIRGARRIPILELALAPYKKSMDSKTYDKLLYALSTVVGIEPFIVLTDVCQIDPEKGRDITRWAVKALVDAALKQE